MTPQDLQKYGLEIVKVNDPTKQSSTYKLYERGDSGSSAGFRDIQGFDPSQYQGLNIKEFSSVMDPNAGRYDPKWFESEVLSRQGYAGANTSKANIQASQLGDIFSQYAARAQNAATAAQMGRQIDESNRLAMQNYTPSDPTRAQQIQALNKQLAGMKNEDIYAMGASLYPELAKQNPYNATTPTFQTATGYTVPNVIPQAKVEGQYLYASDVLDKKANDAAVNALYNAYFNRNADINELKNWGKLGGPDTTVRALENFLQKERADAIKAGKIVPEMGELGKIKEVKITPTKGTTETIGSGKTGSDVARALEENMASAPKSGEKTTIGKLEAFLANQEALAKQVQGLMQPSEEEKSLKSAYVDETARISGQPIQMAFIRGQQAVQDRKYQAQLALLQGERKDKLDAAKFLYDANRNNLSDTISLYKSTAPENIGTHIDETTGTMYVVTKNPLTGETSVVNAGNVGAGKKYTSTSIQTDPVTNQMLFVGVKPDGSIETKALTQGGEKPLSSADRLKYAQDIMANSGYTVTMEDALKQIDQAQGSVSAGTSGNRPDRNNNPLNIKVPAAGLEEAVRRYGDSGVTIDPVPATDGGHFLKFSSPESGMRAAETLLSSSVYSGLSVDVAMRKWSGGGYGAEVSPSIPATATIGSLSPSQRQQLIADMAKREGFTGSIGTGSSGAPAQILDKSPYQNAAQILRASLPEAQSKQVGISLNQALNTGNADQAKSVILSAAITALPADQQNKAFGRAVAIDELAIAQKALDEFVANGGDTGLIAGTVEGISQRIGRTSNPKLAAIGNQIQAAIVAYRSAVSGAAFTESEKAQYESMFPSTGKTPALNQALISSLSDTFRRNQDSVLSQKIGAENYKKIFGAPETTQTPTATAASDILSEFGVKVEDVKPQTQGGGLSKWWDYFFGGK